MSDDSLSTVALHVTTERYALTVEQAAELTGLSKDSLDDARDRGDLEYRYPNRKPLILPGELRRWLESLPTYPPARKAARR